MRQKFKISQNDVKNELKISEYAILNRTPKYAKSLPVQNEKYSLICEETYRSEIVMSSISKGRDSLVATLRTRNLFPIEPYAQKIAESIIELYKLSNNNNDNTVELFFDDVDLLPDRE